MSQGEASYPLATVLGPTGARQTRLMPRADLVREVAIRRLPDHAAADALVVEAARQARPWRGCATRSMTRSRRGSV
ncbi:MAG: hypothetical protein HEQ16_01360 [Bosea sp.]|nr:hypothetical protein [Bosea sp. (in: a-proteobacteria)]